MTVDITGLDHLPVTGGVTADTDDLGLMVCEWTCAQTCSWTCMITLW
jgi:modification target Cys-rich repeat protein